MIPELKERYHKRLNEELVSILQDPEFSASENFWGAQGKIQEIFPVLHSCLDGHSKATMCEKILIMYHEGMFSREDIKAFRPEFQSWFFRKIEE